MNSIAKETVLILGASGFVGSHIARLAVREGRRVRVLLRKTSNPAALKYLPVEIVFGDVLDPSSLQVAMRDCVTVFHCVVDPRFWLNDQAVVFRNNVEGVVNAMEAALAGGVHRFIFTSTMGTLGLDPHSPVTEETPFNWFDRAPPYIRTRLEAENRFLGYCRDKGLPGVALCVANTYGPEDYQPTPHNRELWRVASGATKATVDVSQPTVDIRDVAAAALLAEKLGRIGERYIIANAFVSNRAFYAMAVTRYGRKMPKMIPFSMAYAIAAGTEALARLAGRKDVMISRDALYLANVFRELDSGKARRELGWNPRPLSETIRDAVDWFAAQQPSAVS